MSHQLIKPVPCAAKAALAAILSLAFASFLTAGEYHVSVKGDDANDGSASSPYKSIGKAAQEAFPGDTVIVHEGVYRERVNPPRGGESPLKPITYRAAKGEKVEIKGSEIIKNWKKLNRRTWVVDIPNDFFGGFNPYADNIHGDWLEKGEWCHTGEVYLNGESLSEAPALEQVLDNETDQPLWFCRVENGTTTIWANFAPNPNNETVEINVRQSVFYPDRPHINFIHIRGFAMSQAATPWCPPTAEQIGLVGTHWSKGWVIEDNVVTHSKCVGITLGKYGDEWDNKSGTEEGYIKATQRALGNKWDKEHIGSHIVKNNQISLCGQAGIAGSLGAIFSIVEGNTVFDIALKSSFWGYEMAGIKFHAAVDTVIKGNHIYNTEGGIWLDWMTQGTRITCNLLHHNRVQDFSLEVNHGPVLVDNNLFLSEELAQVKLSQGIVFLNNLIAWKTWPTGMADERKTPYLVPHGTQIAGRHDCPCGDVSYYNNIFTRDDLTVYDTSPLPVTMEGNVFLSEAIPSAKEKKPYIKSAFDPGIKVTREQDGWYLHINIREEWFTQLNKPVPTTRYFRPAQIPNQPFDLEDGSPIVFDSDYLGNKRMDKKFYPGPIDFTKKGPQTIKVFPRK